MEDYSRAPLRDPGPTRVQLMMRRQAEAVAGYVTRLRMQNFPRHLHKFMTFDGSATSLRNLRGIAVSSELWLSSPVDFNDPFDMKCAVVPDADRVAVRKAFNRMGRVAVLKHGLTRKDAAQRVSGMMQNLDSVIKPDLLDKDRRHHGVICLTPHPRNLLMWAHYAQSHRGICLRFCTSRDPGIFSTAIPVDYSDEYPVVHWPSMSSGELRAALLRKGTSWSYEDEHRIVMAGVASRSLPIAPRSLTGIILGCKFPDEHRAQLDAILRERAQAGHPSVSIYRAAISSMRYEVTIRKEP